MNTDVFFESDDPGHLSRVVEFNMEPVCSHVLARPFRHESLGKKSMSIGGAVPGRAGPRQGEVFQRWKECPPDPTRSKTSQPGSRQEAAAG
jgi:hypothetical protein